ncbi:nuclear transport factor 2 family protein [Vagococcus sp. BWB3-3]|uniref:Nuclear transport factor 2 family protein n=1 Tax=Vagococcus allomyrinae TaxID=2794353 RepID=A0A940P3X6_9ENTE|nr:nuclear transport factor 2 family protein [Vagococcus allomyrinae]MBP1040565.1 nuclear transport factor 2 family protein [Vagococcus allomyrinae]
MNTDRMTHYWAAVISQDRETLKKFFQPDATINWHTSNEQFTLGEFLTANCDYPGNWTGKVTRILDSSEQVITITEIASPDSPERYVVTSIFSFKADLISTLDEYWAEITPAPEWRQALQLGKPIK